MTALRFLARVPVRVSREDLQLTLVWVLLITSVDLMLVSAAASTSVLTEDLAPHFLWWWLGYFVYGVAMGWIMPKRVERNPASWREHVGNFMLIGLGISLFSLAAIYMPGGNVLSGLILWLVATPIFFGLATFAEWVCPTPYRRYV
ncbi:MAG: hypothetical protein A2700_02155 [Candidatus Blackburnbacteria bacterium RIFCSPHIGHO2_01_FULL_44_64]|uniref:Uncharacterized protein n=1 Tax=Candidatus Blackburnbacteria bacterium RIFCSPHIGHO2_02_FULL_44_20 TaxID=1797516 RepID=A0A1G1V6K4_9BACT|nr:MAG: hypothetical protein A2700_02155 [Candidatus Blackburnbacteria bacterium RIFCSPHIGHO2_01_FULL_44_64]OGY11038.1 MAG: hypothetical protein A3D26_03950 [Candidatus Blackburnbacteria bacterium RIFCSPHIGHO2_02_FULL_44_20]OGY12164.1 MAG: hypothetical protein A3E16_02715 [Candidatus Blackburnbacteria bacterium RIFCSPHIGHO2_12_FULL_44_25]OGY14410.1 MAG: hypothetical protein A3A62_01875 [Candidatus Blackburnbacteria bacterium RIFCSPLOWO2_01_FULL_44_43]